MNKIFKAYANLIDNFHQMFEDREADLQETTEYRVKHLKSKLETKLEAKCKDFSKLESEKKSLEIELIQYKTDLESSRAINTKLKSDNLRMKYLMMETNK